MKYMCKKCSAVPVQKNGDICQSCNDPYSSLYPVSPPGSSPNNLRASLINGNTSDTDIPNNSVDDQIVHMVSTSNMQNNSQQIINPFGAHINVAGRDTFADQVKEDSVSEADGFELEGVVRNYKEEEIKSFFIERWFRALIKGVPFTIDNTMHSFQVFYNGWATTNANSKVCDNVIIYGQITRGKISQDNTVQVWGKRDNSNTIIATNVYNVSSNTWSKIRYGLNPVLAWIITIIMFSLPFVLYSSLKDNQYAIFIIAGLLLFLIALFNFRLFLKIVGITLAGALIITSGILKMVFGIFHKK